MASAKHRQIAWLLAWIYLTLSGVGEALHGVPGMGHAVHCGQMTMWVGSKSSGCCPVTPVTVNRLDCGCPQSHEDWADEGHADGLVVPTPSPPGGHCPICRYVAMGKWLATSPQHVLASRLVGEAPMARIFRPDAKPHRCVLARGPPHIGSVDS